MRSRRRKLAKAADSSLCVPIHVRTHAYTRVLMFTDNQRLNYRTGMVVFCTLFSLLLASNTCMYVRKCGGVNRVFAAPSSVVAAPAVRSQSRVRCCCCRWQPPLPRVPWPSLSATPAGRTGACPGSTAACTEDKNERAEQSSDNSHRSGRG